MVAACLFYVNTLSWAITDGVIPAAKDTLQAQSMFKPIVDAVGAEYETQLRIETALILAMALKESSIPFQDINASLDEWYSMTPSRDGRRILNVISNPSRENDSVAIDLEVFYGPRKGKKFTITSSCQDITDFVKETSNVNIVPVSKAKEKAPNREEPPAEAAGNISKGFTESAIQLAMIRIRKNSGRIKKNNVAIIDTIRKKSLSLLRKLLGSREKIEQALERKAAAGKITGDEQKRALRALSSSMSSTVLDKLRSPEDSFAWFNAAVEGKERYLLGNDSALAVDVAAFLNYYDEMRDFPVNDLLQEYILHEALEAPELRFSHETVIEITSAIFDRLIITGPGSTPLGKALRHFINEKGEAPIPTKKVPGTRGLVDISSDIAAGMKALEIDDLVVIGRFGEVGVIKSVQEKSIVCSMVAKDGKRLDRDGLRSFSKQEIMLAVKAAPRRVNIMRRLKGASQGRAQIGKRAFVENIRISKGKIETDVRGSKGIKHTIILNSQGKLDIGELKKQIKSMPKVDYSHKRTLISVLSLFEKSPPEVYTYDILIEDLFGFASSEHNLIALHEDFTKNPAALFHEAGEYLTRSKALNLKLKGNVLEIDIDGKQSSVTLGEEALAIAQKDPASPHYLLRALTRQVFGESDRGLTQEIKRTVGPASQFSQIDECAAADKTLSEEETPEILEKAIRQINNECKRIKHLTRKHMMSIAREAEVKQKTYPVDIIVDLSLISRDDLKANMDTWAYLILSYLDIKNVNFRFEMPDPSGDNAAPEALLSDIENAPSEIEALAALKEAIKEKAIFYEKDIDIDEIFATRVNSIKRENTIEVPILSAEWLKWMREKALRLKEDQYPVALEGLTSVKDEGALLRNFDAALTIGLAKASLVIAKKRDEERGKSEELPELAGKLLPRLQKLYDIFGKSITLSEETLSNMVNSSSTTRLNLAISLALPPIVRMAVDKLKDLHEKVHLVLQAA